MNQVFIDPDDEHFSKLSKLGKHMLIERLKHLPRNREGSDFILLLEKDRKAHVTFAWKDRRTIQLVKIEMLVPELPETPKEASLWSRLMGRARELHILIPVITGLVGLAGIAIKLPDQLLRPPFRIELMKESAKTNKPAAADAHLPAGLPAASKEDE